MTEVIFIVFDQEKSNTENRKKRLKDWIRTVMKRKGEPLHETEVVTGSVKTIFVMMPFSQQAAVSSSKRRFFHLLEDLQRNHPGCIVYVPKSFNTRDADNAAFRYVTVLKVSLAPINIMKANLPEILDYLCSRKKAKPGDLNVIVLPGGNMEELFELVKYIAPSLRYVTAVIDDRESTQSLADDIYNEFGLPVGLSSDIKNSIKKADVVISLKSREAFDKIYRTGRRSAVIDLTGNVVVDKIEGGTAIRGVEVLLPQELETAIPALALKTYGRSAIAEIITMLNAGFEPGSMVNRSEDIKKIKAAFVKIGFSINAVIGRHNIVMIGNIEPDSQTASYQAIEE